MNSGSIAVWLAVVGALLSVVGTLLLLIFNDIRKQVKENTRHVSSLANSYWMGLVRMNAIEDHLTERDGYKPPKLIGDHEQGLY